MLGLGSIAGPPQLQKEGYCIPSILGIHYATTMEKTDRRSPSQEGVLQHPPCQSAQMGSPCGQGSRDPTLLKRVTGQESKTASLSKGLT